MKTKEIISPNQRTINIINRAIENGFEFDETDSMETIRIQAEDFLIDNVEHTEVECEVSSIGSHGQRVDWSDGYGYNHWEQGQIIDWYEYRNDSPDTKIKYSYIVDSKANVIALFSYVGENDYNTVR